MYHTLIPHEERKALRREYRVRAAIVLCFALSLAGIVGIAALLPAFISAAYEVDAANNDLASIKKAKDQSGLTQIQQKVASSQTLLAVLDKDSAKPRLSVLSETVLGQREGIRIDSLGLNYNGTTSVSFTLSGMSPTRDALIAFKNRLLNIHPGNKVDLPVSELAKSANIDFTMQINWPLK